MDNQNKNPKLKKNGGEGTKVGNFLRSLDFGKVAEVVGHILDKDIASAVKVISNKDNGLTEAEREFALTVMRLDIEEMDSVTRRWESDNLTDSFLSKNVRPLSLVFLTLATTVLIFIDSFNVNVSVGTEWIDLLKSLLLGIYIAYFGSRGLEKYRTITKG
tara:strand:+ start:206 stop:685 length:480 start_codon:yes stop_codon:yes gene_type:complete